ncbi:MAG: hypothetical protein COA74_13435 [Gammaproteobacteria bacterium]|nr:MAG: hypothetical protein COA74_13435 [Gammaproteobacteria bacterium]
MAIQANSLEKIVTRNRILFYLFLALACYTLASLFAATYAFILFVGVGMVAELLFWFNLLGNKTFNIKKTKTEL